MEFSKGLQRRQSLRAIANAEKSQKKTIGLVSRIVGGIRNAQEA
jgi:hypothetical protein